MNIFIVAVKSKDKEFIKELKKDSFTVGRAIDCDISLNDSHVSRVHLVVSSRGDQIWIEDKNSANGTFLNSAKLIQGTPVNVSSNDKIQLGKSQYSLTVKLKSRLQEAPAPKVEKAEPKSEVPLPKVLSPLPPKAVSPQLVVEDNTVDIVKQNIISIQDEQALHEAKRKAAQIVLEGEAQAEKQVQAIYEKARVTREQAEKFYQEKTAEARKKAEAILDEAQSQGQKLIGDARTLARAIREEVDAYVETYKEKSKRESEQLIASAEKTAEKIKNEAYEQGRKAAQQEAAHIVEMAQRHANEIADKSKDKAEELNQLTHEFKDLQNKLASANSSLDQTRGKENELNLKIEQEEERIRHLVHLEEDQLKALQANQQELMTENSRLEADTRDLQGKNAQLRLAISDLEEQKNILTKAYAAQKIQFEEKLEKEKLQIEKTEKSYYEEMRLELAKRLEQMEQDLLANIINKKVSLIKKIFTVVETETVKVVEMSQWKKLAPEIDVKINETFENELISLSQSSVNTKKPVDLMKKREGEKHRYMGLGLVAGALLFFGGQVLFEKVTKDKTPMQTLVAKEAKLRQEDLQRRQFNPPQVDELKETYTDAVIYTKNFAQTYGNQEFQQNFYKAVSQYLFKTWRIDEDKSIQIVSTANALVQELADKKSKIHPDFVKNGIDKMRTLEQETLIRMRDILGSDVRVESFRTFERKFYSDQIKQQTAL